MIMFVKQLGESQVENDSNLTGLSSNDDMFSISSYFSTDDCPPTISPNCFSTESDEKLIERDDDVFSSEDEGKFLSQGDVVSCASQADILAEKMEEINPFVNILKMTMGEKIQDEDCWSREDMPSTQEEVCFSSSSKEYMDL